MMNIDSAERYLKDFKEKLNFWGLVLRTDRGKNKSTMLELELYAPQVKLILKELVAEDYSEGPLEDTLYKLSDMWVFGKEIKGQEVYIKITLGNPGQQVICISFHFSERPMSYPLKTKKP